MKELDILKDDDPTKDCRNKVWELVKHELDQLEAVSMTTSSNTTSNLSFNTTAATLSESSQLTELQSDMDLILSMNILDEEAEESRVTGPMSQEHQMASVEEEIAAYKNLPRLKYNTWIKEFTILSFLYYMQKF